MHASNSAASVAPNVVPLSTSGQSSYALERLSDSELFEGTRRLIARSNHHLADLLAHLAEVEARGIHRLRACSSLYTYCLYELRLSEDMAYRHARAAKIARRFPIAFEQLAAGEIHLTGLLLLGPHMTEANHREVLRRAKHRTKREIEKLARLLAPLPDVPARIEPLGPVREGSPMSSGTWHDFVSSMNPVRELEPGLRPKDWKGVEGEADFTLEVQSEPERQWKSEREPHSPPELHSPPEPELQSGSGTSCADSRKLGETQSEPEHDAELGIIPQRYKVQFTVSQEYVELLERAQDLLSHAMPSRSIEELHLRAMRGFVSMLEKRRYATKEGVRSKATSKPEHKPEHKQEQEQEREQEREREREREQTAEPKGEFDLNESEAAISSQRVPDGAPATEDPAGACEVSAVRSFGTTRQRGRYTPAEVRRRVHERDGARCAYVDSLGRRCRETGFLELHHRDPFARGGPATPENLALYCRSHNALAAEQDFGQAHMAQKTRRD